MNARLIQVILAVGGLGAAGVWTAMQAARTDSLALTLTAGFLLVVGVAGLLVIVRALVLVERGQRL